MGKIFDLDSPIMRGLSKMADVMWLNILVLVFALPLIIQQYLMLGALVYDDQSLIMNYVFWAWIVGIVASIPLGPALTAMHFVLLKIVRDEESYITKTFFKSFKENFKQSSILMIIQFVAGGILVMDFLLMKNAGVVYRYIITAASIILLMAAMYIFPLQSKFQNKILGTLKNSFLVAIMALPRTAAMLVVSLFPVLLYYFFGLKLVPLLILIGIAGPGYACAALYNETFKKFEPKEEEVSEEQELENAIKKIEEDEKD
ncbi:MAG: DUF624 domain-containing protein [Butyrivibrio sp.]|nr:DUF624 domain-containing protein [Butyrivibrio sp.]MBE5824197.1 DUF624 domain-containing protein [Butyrivibrio sp.]MBQ8030831.1 DUF624 domain-containing protein [Butyrivibrio sp.]MBR1642891.1 DUF624 domain-containing protein [Butyrivibrio sp.]